jgi:1-acyl-sn-glycerol-3-phosphate acyltransferase
MHWYYITPLIFQRIIWVPVRLILKLWLSIEIRGLDNILPLKQGAILISNHSSYLDPIIIPGSFNFFSKNIPVFFVSRERNFYPLKGFIADIIFSEKFFKLWGAHRVFHGMHNYALSMVNQINLLKDGKNILVFPEGKIGYNNKVEDVKGGVGYLACISNKPVVPISIQGLYNKKMSDILLFKCKVVVIINKPIYFKEFISDHMGLSELDSYKYFVNKSAEIINKNLL